MSNHVYFGLWSSLVWYIVVSRRPTLKRETVYKKFELWNVYWMTFKCYISVLFTSQHPFNQIRLQHYQTNGATLFIQHYNEPNRIVWPFSQRF